MTVGNVIYIDCITMSLISVSHSYVIRRGGMGLHTENGKT